MRKSILVSGLSLTAVVMGAWFIVINNEPVQAKNSRNDDNTAENPVKPHEPFNGSGQNSPAEGSSYFTKTMSYDSNWCNNLQLSEDAKLQAEREHNRWLQKRGYNLENKVVYQSYSQETLLELADEGGTVALSVLAEDNDKSISLEAAREAAVYGLTGAALLPIMLDYEGKAKRLSSDGDMEAAKNMYMHSLAWQEYAAMRGDYTHIQGTVYRLRNERTVVDIEPEDYKKISALAENLYAQLNEKRKQKRLPVFDDKLPKVVQKLNSLTIASIETKDWNGWGSHLKADRDCVNQNIAFLSSK